MWIDPALSLLQERGLEHERRYVQALTNDGFRVLELSEHTPDGAVVDTLEAMHAGVDVIIQAGLKDGRWFGRPDVLRRVETPSLLGSWSYEAVDTKLAKETRGATVLQLALYSDLLRATQGTLPTHFRVVTPALTNPIETFRVLDFAAYFRLIRANLESIALEHPETIAAANYPEPVEHCEVCRWWSSCDKRRHDDDHLSLVAGISRLQTRELETADVSTLADLATLPLPLPFSPHRGAIDTYIRVHHQARVQLAGRTQGQPVHEVLQWSREHGLLHLPAPSTGDIFLDLEGDPFACDGGREYLFGLAVLSPYDSLTYQAHWAYTAAEERAAFETIVDFILASWTINPDLHIYHYASYEPAAFKRLMGRHATREAEIDRMLRAGLFVDLYTIVKHSIRASVERYSIKDLEPFYGYPRAVDLAAARANLRVVERALELHETGPITADVRAAVAGYNQDDCISAYYLRNWLEQLRRALEESGEEVPRPQPKDDTPPEKLDERTRRVQALAATLIADVPTDALERNEDQQARWLLAHLLDWHRREGKAAAWEFYRLCELKEDELLEERDAIACLTYIGRVGGKPQAPIDRYGFPPQDTDVAKGDGVRLPDGTRLGTVDAIDHVARTVDIKKTGAQANTHPSSLFAYLFIDSDVLQDALIRLAESVHVNGMHHDVEYRSARQLLLRQPPRLREGSFEKGEDETAVDFAVRVASELESTVLPIQGPPGAGKTFTGARIISDLVRRGLRVGVTAVSHNVIRKLLGDAVQAAAATGLTASCAQKVTSKSREPVPGVKEFTDNAKALATLHEGSAQVLGGTAWFWARPEAQSAVDVLLVDEAGQISLANVLAVSHAAKSIILLGDPQQLKQPQKGTHPEGTEVSALEFLLAGDNTIPEDSGIFLPETWRLAPAICEFTSEVFYEGRLHSRAGLEQQQLLGTEPFEGSGLWVVGVPHEGNQNSAPEEVDAVERIVASLLHTGARWTDGEGVTQPLTAADILVVTPYNAHLALLGERLAAHAIPVGTVDKFQGQEAPVVIYSMATSSPEEAPRGMEFLYSLDRLNVATSRARCACILVASPRLFEPECKSPRQMQLANALCRYVELSHMVSVP